MSNDVSSIAIKNVQSLKHLLGFPSHDGKNESRVSIKNDVIDPDNTLLYLLIFYRDTLQNQSNSHLN